MTTSEFQLGAIEPLTLVTTPPLSGMYTLSPYVWRDGARWEMLLRAVPRRDDMPALKIARVHHGRSTDGLRFVMGDAPAPGPGEEDRDGCEDPTVVVSEGAHYVFYSGWNEAANLGQLLLAVGPDGAHLEKRGVVLPSTPTVANPKEATVVQAADGTWRLFFEYAADGASRIGLATAPRLDGPWAVGKPPFSARRDRWDGWHLSTGPIIHGDADRPVMFYNGATQDAKWRIGWVAFDAEYTRVVARSEEPFIMPPRPEGNATDIAFAASAVEEEGATYLYYSVSDQHLYRAAIRRV